MKKIIISLLVPFVTAVISYAQDCTFYYPQSQGSELVYKMYDKKGKFTGTTSHTVREYHTTAKGAEATIHVKSTDDKGEHPYESDLQVRCESGTFYFDMTSYINQQSMEAYKDMEIKMETENLEMPSHLNPGDKLKDGHIKMEIFNNGFKLMTMDILVTNRVVAAKEDVTTEAGTFHCVKLGQTVIAKIPIRITTNSHDWFNPGIGLIKSESYSGDKINSSMILTEINK